LRFAAVDAPGRRRILKIGIALNATIFSLGAAGFSATPAAAAKSSLKTETAWIPLGCNLAGGLSGGIPTHLGVALKATLPKIVNPGQTFRLKGVTAVQVLGPGAQNASAVFHATALAGVIRDFEQNLTSAKGAFVAPDNGTQINVVRALQPPNVDAPPAGKAKVSQSSLRDPLVDPNTANPSPLAAFADNGLAASSPLRHGVFSFGPIPVNSNGATANAYGPAPGTGGGPSLSSGNPDPLTIRPFKVTGAGGQNVVMDVGKPGAVVTLADGSPPGRLVAIAGVYFFNPTPRTGFPNGRWNGQTTGEPIPVVCGKDTSARALPKPDPAMVDRFVIPISCDETADNEDDGGGRTGCEGDGQVSVIQSVSAAGGRAGTAGTVASILAILTAFLLVAVRRRRLHRT
jgi:hypothetical protein